MGTVKRTRPLYAYPSVARYAGKGDVNDAANWREHKAEKMPEDRSVAEVAFRRLNDLLHNLQRRVDRARKLGV